MVSNRFSFFNLHLFGVLRCFFINAAGMSKFFCKGLDRQARA
jgi:hypothetical protein